MLRHGKSSVGEIAAQLGFSEPSAFHRAFRKWTSKKPRRFPARDGFGCRSTRKFGNR
ncbi:helix-turn-helix domain-containing protein [Pararhizobium sp. LjRoot238]|uniref:helix-turn-helix domain-containing protein n=1 Tax=Pararhizobium sp. LjRoot238 TaxID=3342293 RepID=UPI003F4F5B93